MNIGNKVKISELDKLELISLYQLRMGLSGVSLEDINKEFKVQYFEGSNICVVSVDGVYYSLNKNRFELC